jgi:hypothetical protein
MRCE